MKASIRLQIESSEKREAINALLAKGDELSDDDRTELATHTERMGALEVELRAALTAEGADDPTPTDADGLKPEQRERLELRGKATLGAYLKAALTGRMVGGAEAELAQAAGVDGIPFELWETREVLEARAAEQRVVTPAGATVGINLDLVRPAVFAPSIAAGLMIDMPRVESGTYASATISTSVTGGAVAKSGAVPETAGALTAVTTTPHRVGGSLALTLEDIAAIGQANFESAFRDNVSLVISDQIDDQLINGDGTGNNLFGMFKRLDDATAPAANAETWTRFVAIQAGVIDGLWASKLSHVQMVVGVETYALAAATLRSGNAADQTALEHWDQVGGGVWTNKRMPAKASHIQLGIACRKGRPGMRTAVAPTWGYFSVDDIYTGRLKGERSFTISALIGDVILVQPDAYEELKFRVSV